MIRADYARTMAAYNAWQNRSLTEAADTLDDAARQANRGAFFGSIQGTFNHVLWGDQTWMTRLADMPPPAKGSIAESVSLHEDWAAFRHARAAFDQTIIDWAARLSDADLNGALSWFSGAVGREVSRPRALLVTHFFNHQTHHRGQIHAMLTAAGATPQDTDIAFMPGLDV